MSVNCVDDWDDDWENTDIPDLIINLQDTIKNRERELKLLEERKKMEEADLALAEQLFDKPQNKPILFDSNKSIKKEKPKELKMIQEKKKTELREKQKQQSQKQKAKQELNKRLKDIFGEAEEDEYNEQYGKIEDKY